MTRRTRLLVGVVLGLGVGTAAALTWAGVGELVTVKPPGIVVDLRGPEGGTLTGELSRTPRWDADPIVTQVEWAIPSRHRFDGTAVTLDWKTGGEVTVEMTIDRPDDDNRSQVSVTGPPELTDEQRLQVNGSSAQNVATSLSAPRLRWEPLVMAAMALLLAAGFARLLPWLEQRKQRLDPDQTGNGF